MAPSSLNCTLAIPAEPVAEAETVTALPLTVAPFAGAVMETDGAVTLLTVTEIPAAVPTLPAVSVATADRVWAPLDTAVVSHEML